MSGHIASVKTYSLRASREKPYLGSPLPGEVVTDTGYIIRKHNKTIYPIFDRSVVVQIMLQDGLYGWGETYGLVAPEAVAAIIKDVVSPWLIGRDPLDVQVIWEDLYDMMRVRGYTGGFYLDALAAVDIALWDIVGKCLGQPVYKLLGGMRRREVPAYVSGLAKDTRDERIALAVSWRDKGFKAVKLHAVVAGDHVIAELAALRDALGPDFELMLDMHWMHTSAQALRLIDHLRDLRISFVEAPVKTEDVSGLASVVRGSPIPVAAGEEWRTVFDAQLRMEAAPLAIVQPEMGHTGITQFVRIARLAEAYHARVYPHATIGAGIFMTASLHAACALGGVDYHEYQPTIFHRGSDMLDNFPTCEAGVFSINDGIGLGIEPTSTFWSCAQAL